MSEHIVKAPHVPPFVTFVTSTVPMVFDNSLSYYEALCALWKWLQDDVVNVINNNATVTEDYIDLTNEYTQKFIELKEYVDTYFDNLDVQEEINNKLDAMVEDGTLQQLIASYLQTQIIYDTTEDMIADAEHLQNGVRVETLGYHAVDDGGAAFFVIKDSGTANGYSVIDLGDGLYAHMIFRKGYVTPEMFGAYGDGTHDDATYIEYCVAFGIDKIVFNNSYLIESTIVVNNKHTLTGNGTIILGGQDFNAITVTANKTVIDGLNFTNPSNYAPSTLSSGDIGDAIRIKADDCIVRNCTIDNYIAGIVFNTNGGSNIGCTIENNHIKVKGTSSGWVNDGICSLGKNAVISGNFVTCEDTTNYARAGICCDIHADNCMVNNNIVVGNSKFQADIHSEQSVGVVISNNQCFTPRAVGIVVADQNIISNNYVETPSQEAAGYSLDECAIQVYAGTDQVVSGNIIKCMESTMYGVRSNGGARAKYIGNSFVGTDGNVKYCMYMRITHHVLIANNSFYIKGDTAIYTDAEKYVRIIGNFFRGGTVQALRIYECDDFIISDNEFISTPTAIWYRNSPNGQINGNVFGDSDSSVTTAIEIANTASHRLNFANNNSFVNVTARYKNTSYGNMLIVSDENQKDLVDSTLGTRKTITVDNGSIAVA